MPSNAPCRGKSTHATTRSYGTYWSARPLPMHPDYIEPAIRSADDRRSHRVGSRPECGEGAKESRYAAGEWRVTFFLTGREHSQHWQTGSAQKKTPWLAVQKRKQHIDPARIDPPHVVFGRCPSPEQLGADAFDCRDYLLLGPSEEGIEIRKPRFS